MKIWIIKQALTKGIIEAEVLEVKPNGLAATVRTNTGDTMVYTKDYRNTKEEALTIAERMKEAEVQKLQRQADQLREKQIQVVEYKDAA